MSNEEEVKKSSEDLVKHTGSCHCGAVRFEAWAPRILYVVDCNICKKKQNKHVIIPESRFTLLKGEDHLTTYQFNTGKAKHPFCKTCGVQCFYRPRSNPDGVGFMPHCIDSDTVDKICEEAFDGKEWQKSMDKHPNIKERSKIN